MGIPFLTKAYDLLKQGRFGEAIQAYKSNLATESTYVPSVRGLAKAYLGAGRYMDAISLLWQVHHDEKSKIKDHPGQQLQIACACWCIEDRTQAIELTRGLCVGILNRSVGMAPDLAGGATYGLILHYMASTAHDTASFDYALKYLEKLKVKYDKRPDKIQAPQQSVRQLLGFATFEPVLEEATFDILDKRPGVRALGKAKKLAQKNITIKNALRVALFHDGAYRRSEGDEAGCTSRMQEVMDLGIEGDLTRWYLARHEFDSQTAR